MTKGWKNVGPARWELMEGDICIVVEGDFENNGWMMTCETVGWQGVPLKANEPEGGRVEALSEVTQKITLLAMQVLELNGKLETAVSKVSVRSKPGSPVSHETAHAFASIAAAGALELERQTHRDLVRAAEMAVRDLVQGSDSRIELEAALSGLK